MKNQNFIENLAKDLSFINAECQKKVLYTLGNNLISYGDPAGAISCYDQPVQIAIKDADAWYRKGLALTSLKKYLKASTCFERAIQLDSKNASYWLERAIALSRLSEVSEFSYCKKEGIKLNPPDHHLWSTLGEF